jgi:hypothetical protein
LSGDGTTRVYGTVTDNGLEHGPEGMPFFMVKLDDEGVQCKAYLSDLKPAPPAAEPPKPILIGSRWKQLSDAGEFEVTDIEELRIGQTHVRAYRANVGSKVYDARHFRENFEWRQDP